MAKRKVKIKELKMNLFVRKALNQDHAIYLGELLESGQQLPPIKINPEKIVIDGRHRIEAHELAGRDEIDAEVLDFHSEAELIAEAYKANVGGALPPTREDTEHTIMVLLEKEVPKRQIAEMLAIPPSMARKYVNEVQSKMKRATLQKAVDAVAHGGLNVPKAAEQYSVDEDALREVLSGTRRKNKKGLPDIKRELTRQFKSSGQKTAAVLRKLSDKLEDSDVTPKQVREILDHVDHLLKTAGRTLGDWRKRFEARGVPADKEK